MTKTTGKKLQLGFCCLLALFMMMGCAGMKQKKDQAKKHRNLGEAYMVEGNFSQAYTQLEKSRQMNPKDPHVYFDLGIFFYHKKKYDSAVANYKKAIALNPDFATAINNLGVVYMEQKKWDLAITTLRPITEQFAYATPHFPHYLIGQAYFHKQQYEKAVYHLRQSLSLQPTYVFARYWLGKVYLAAGETKKATTALEKAVEQVPQAAAFYLDLGRAYQQAGRFKEAAQSFAQAAALATDENLKKEALQLKRLAEKKQG